MTLIKHWRRVVVTLIPLVFVLAHALSLMPLVVLQRLDEIIYDTRLRATMPATLDPRIVIVDIDERSLAQVGRWPWARNQLARLVDELVARQQVALVGFDMVFGEADEYSGLKQLQQLARKELSNQPAFLEQLAKLQAQLDYDALFAKSLQNRPVVLGFYLTSDRDGQRSGTLPAPAFDAAVLRGRDIAFTRWNGYGANIEALARAAPAAGFFNAIADSDGVLRSVPLIAEYQGRHYESLSLAMLRRISGAPGIELGFPAERMVADSYQGLASVILRPPGAPAFAIPVDDRVAALVPYRGAGGPNGGSFRYVSAADLLAQRLAPAELRGKIVLLGTTAPGLFDLRTTPVAKVYPGVEVHANMISGLLDGRVLTRPDYALGFEVLMLLLLGLSFALLLPRLSALRAVLVSLGTLLALVGLHTALYLSYGLVLPMASSLVLLVAAFALNMSYGYFVESRSKRELANLFGTYVPPELVDEMVKQPESYSMQAANKELTVMFCDMRGFTQMSETMGPTELQTLLNAVFSRLTELIRRNRGTVDKYMGDCVMAFWGAPVAAPDHAALAVTTARQMVLAVEQFNAERAQQGLTALRVGVGLNTGTMCVGDMGSVLRRSYTVVGDAVNLASRLEGLSKLYGVDIVASETTRQAASGMAWQELDRVRVKGKERAVSIFTPLAADTSAEELKVWNELLRLYRAQNWEQCELQLLNLERLNAKKVLYELYAQRVALRKNAPLISAWDGATDLSSK